MLHALRSHWPEYLAEAWGLGIFMVAAGLAALLVEIPTSPLYTLIHDADLRQALRGIAMGLTAIGVIYSPWGKRSGAHFNPAVTLVFLRLGKIAKWDALFYVLAQFIGGMLGVLLMLLLFGDSFALPPVSYIVTVPGPPGDWLAFAAELLISLGLMLAVLILMNHKNLRHMTGLASGVLLALFITLEAPLSGTSMNPARSFASAIFGGNWASMWIYLSAPFLGMLAAVDVYHLLKFSTARMCAKLYHADGRRCIHCGYEPQSAKENLK